MFSRIHDKLGTAGLVVAIVALVAALTGTALAAAGLSIKQKKEVTKIAKKYAGKRGATGPAGAQGPAGTSGAKGATGAAGVAGKGVKTGEEPEGGNCSAGGVWVEVEGSGSKEFVCNGENGAASGPQTLLNPAETETGDWAFVAKGIFSTYATISFPLRLEEPPTFHFVTQGSSNPECPGNFQSPGAKPGNFCVFARQLENSKTPETFGGQLDPTSGEVLEFTLENEAAEAYGQGTWAVTACPEEGVPC